MDNPAAVGQINRDRPVELERSLVHELHHHVREHELGQGRAVHDRVGLKRQIGRDIAMAPTADERNLTILDDRHGQALDPRLAHHPFRFAVDTLGIDWRAVKAMNRRLGTAHRCCVSEGGRQGRRAYRAHHVRHHRIARVAPPRQARGALGSVEGRQVSAHEPRSRPTV
jgi:hypothetical protein